MVARLNGTHNLSANNAYRNDSPPLKRDTSVNYYTIPNEEDPFTDKPNFDLPDESQEEAIITLIGNMLQEVERSGMQQSQQNKIR